MARISYFDSGTAFLLIRSVALVGTNAAGLKLDKDGAPGNNQFTESSASQLYARLI